MIARGGYEICLIGQDLGSYGLDRAGKQLLPELLANLSSISGDWRVRMLYIHPDRFPMDVLSACKSDSHTPLLRLALPACLYTHPTSHEPLW
ncbi:hypothetical protein MASR2M48_20920 [Spirochaetota bacterium]